MSATIQFVTGFVRAVLWSGGLYWRLPIMVGIIPYWRQNPVVSSALEYLGMTEISNWFFYFVGAFLAAVVFAGRIAFLEVPRLKIERQGRIFDGEKHFIRLQIRNRSLFRDATNALKLELTKIEPHPPQGAIERPVNLPLVLPTQQRLKRHLKKGKSIPARRWTLPKRETKWVEVFQVMTDPVRLALIHESGEEILWSTEHKLHYAIYGFGPPVEFVIKTWETKRGLEYFVIKDAADNLAIEQLSTEDLFSDRDKEDETQEIHES